MKKTFLMFAFFVVGMTAMAQSTRTIKGSVLDKYGNPLPGAEVETNNSGESTTVDADGTFTLEVPTSTKALKAKYGGMRPKTMRISDDEMIFMMGKKDSKYFVSALGGLSFNNISPKIYGKYGLMGGNLKAVTLRDGSEIGYYGKVSYMIGSGMSDAGFPTITVGGTIGARWIYMNYGVGYSSVWYGEYSNKRYQQKRSDGFAIDLGFVFIIKKHFSLSYCSTVSFTKKCNFDTMLGVGYVF